MNSNNKVSWTATSGLLGLALLSSSFFMGGCSTTAKTESMASPTPTPAMTNGELESKINEKFKTDAQIEAANLSVDASAERNEITLSGTVGSESLRTKAVDLAKSAHPGLIVTTKIDVKPGEISRTAYTIERAREQRIIAKERGETLGESLDDAWIHTKIVAQMIGNSMTQERKINVDVNHNIVTLRGTVENLDQKQEAERVAKNTESVKSVNNQLKVGPATAKK